MCFAPGEHVVEVTSVGNNPDQISVVAYVSTDDQLEIATLRVCTLNRKTVTVKFFNVSDNFGHGSVLTDQDADAILTVMNEIWEKQANVQLMKAPNWFKPLTITENLGQVIQAHSDGDSDGVCDEEDVDGLSEGEIVFAYRDMAIPFNIFLCWEVAVECPPTDNPPGIFDSAEAYTLGGRGGCLGDQNMGDNTNVTRGDIYAHEIGHHFSYLGNPESTHADRHFAHGSMTSPGNANGDYRLGANLMAAQNQNGQRRITLRQAYVVNSSLPNSD